MSLNVNLSPTRLFGCLWVIFAAATAANAAQLPLQRPLDAADGQIYPNSTSSGWRLDIPLSSITTSNFMFESVNSLLQQWGNTRNRNGHTIIPAIIPKGTLLYHGTSQREIPTHPEWMATDPEHAYMFCAGYDEGSCWQLTLAVETPLNVLYFDGSSAAKMYGALDTQDLIAYGEVIDTTNRNYDEDGRIQKLCEWGKRHNLDGFVRMQMNFELMICNFHRNPKVISFDELVPRFPALPLPDIPTGPPPTINLTHLPTWRIVESGQWHNHFPGETRIKLDLPRLLTFYDLDMAPSLSKARHGKTRFQHRAGLELDEADKLRFMERLEEIVRSKRYSRSGIDWSSVYRVVIHRYAERLEVLQYVLNQTTPHPKSQADLDQPKSLTLTEIVEYVETMISPYLLYNARPPTPRFPRRPPLSWAAPIFEKCATTHTKLISDIQVLTYSEKLLLRAVNDVSYEICRVVVGIWAEGVELGLSERKPVDVDPLPLEREKYIKRKWYRDIDDLMAWLDWSVSVKCRPACNFEETCYLPTWPFFHPDGHIPYPRDLTDNELSGDHISAGYSKDRRWGWVKSFEDSGRTEGEADVIEDRDYWMKPRPRCMRRVAPLRFPH